MPSELAHHAAPQRLSLKLDQCLYEPASARVSCCVGRALMSRFPWSSVTVERLLILRAQGLRLSRIAAELGTTTYAIEHKLRRLRSQKPTQAPAARPLKLFDLRPDHCRWIVSGSGAEALFCGKPRVGTSPYCIEHTQRAWQRSNREGSARPTQMILP